MLYSNRVSISNHFRDNGHFYIWVTTLTFLGRVTSSVTWPFDSPGAISYRCSIVTESLSPTIFEIMDIFYIWVTTLTFLGHVTSSVMWPIDPPYVISYWCSIVTELLSQTVFEIFGPQNLCAHTDTPKHTETRRKWFYILYHAMYCIWQTINNNKISTHRTKPYQLWIKWKKNHRPSAVASVKEVKGHQFSARGSSAEGEGCPSSTGVAV